MPRAFAPLTFALVGLSTAPADAATLTVTVLDAQGRPLPDAVVAVEPRGQRSSAPAGSRAEMAQRGRAFDPALLVVQTGTPVSFPNFDTVRHHVYSLSPVKRFEIKLYAGTPAQPEVFDKPGIAVLGCNIHDRMVSHIVVVDTPHFARTDAAGQAVLKLPAGEHQLLWWHASLGIDAGLRRQPLPLAEPGRALTLAAPAQ